MGTNFYFVDRETGDELRHIGKRSAAGMFCWDCGLSLCAAGNADVHKGVKNWLKECAVCGNNDKDGVSLCCSFTWAMSPGLFSDIKGAPNVMIRDEYGGDYSISEFSSVLNGCPIQFFHLIGKEFT
jgi:hypothetical protein